MKGVMPAAQLTQLPTREPSSHGIRGRHRRASPCTIAAAPCLQAPCATTLWREWRGASPPAQTGEVRMARPLVLPWWLSGAPGYAFLGGLLKAEFRAQSSTKASARWWTTSARCPGQPLRHRIWSSKRRGAGPWCVTTHAVQFRRAGLPAAGSDCPSGTGQHIPGVSCSLARECLN